MAASSSAVVAFTFGFLPLVSKKLTRANYSMWYAQVSSTLNGAQFANLIDPTVLPPSKFLPPSTEKPDDPPLPNPEYEKWHVKDQQVLSYLFSSLSKEIFAQVSSAKTVVELWASIQELHTSQSCARTISTHMALATASKGSSTVAEHFDKMRSLADEMATAGRKLEDEEHITYILTRLRDEFEFVVSAVAVRVEPISIAELYAQLISFEQRKELNSRGYMHPTTLLVLHEKLVWWCWKV
jgi:hypothetical protein